MNLGDRLKTLLFWLQFLRYGGDVIVFLGVVWKISRVYLNGVFYWLVKCECGKQIVLFYMKTDEFWKIIKGTK